MIVIKCLVYGIAIIVLGTLAVGAFILNMEEHEERRKEKENDNRGN